MGRPREIIVVYDRRPPWLKLGEQVESDDYLHIQV